MIPPSVASALAGKLVLVTGASGFLGLRLVERLVAECGAKVTAAVRAPNRAGKLKGLDVRLASLDLGRGGQPDSLVAGQEIVFNLAYDFRQSDAANLAAYRSLADASARAGVKRFVQVSSIAVYDAWPQGDLTEASPSDEPRGAYKTGKRAIERDLLARSADGSLPGTILQPTLVYGPRSALWTDRFAEQLADGAVLLPSNAEGLCNAVHVDEVVDALLLAATAPEAVGEIFIVSGAQPITWARLLGSYAEALGRPEALQYAELAPPASAENGPAGGGLAASILGEVRRRVGGDAVERLRAVVKHLKGSRGPVTHYPDADLYGLFTLQGTCHVDKARRLLGYDPPADPASALAGTAEYVRRTYGASVRD